MSSNSSSVTISEAARNAAAGIREAFPHEPTETAFSTVIQSAIDSETAALNRQGAQLMDVIAGKNREIEGLREQLADTRAAMNRAEAREERRCKELDAMTQERNDYRHAAGVGAMTLKTLETEAKELREALAALLRVADECVSHKDHDTHCETFSDTRETLSRYPAR